MNSIAAIHSVGRTTSICFQAGWETKLNIAKNGRRSCLGSQVRIRRSFGKGSGRSGEIARSSGINENVEEKDRRKAVKGGGWCEQRLVRGENTRSVLERARRLNSGAQAGIAAGSDARALRRRI